MIFVDAFTKKFDLGWNCSHMVEGKTSQWITWLLMLWLKYTSDGVEKNARFMSDIVSPWGGVSDNEHSSRLASKTSREKRLARGGGR